MRSVTTQHIGPPDDRPQAWRLADEMRRVIQRLVLVRAPEEELAAAADAAAQFADRLEDLRISEGIGEISEASLAFGAFMHHSPISGLANPISPPLSMSVEDGPDGQVVHGKTVFGPAYEGPPGHVHGGFVAATYDEMLGRAQGRPGFTAYLTVQYRRPTPLLVPLTWRAWMDREEGRKRWVKATCSTADGLISEAEGLFVSPREDHPLYDRVHRRAAEHAAMEKDGQPPA